jgi:hypothetical protein
MGAGFDRFKSCVVFRRILPLSAAFFAMDQGTKLKFGYAEKNTKDNE